MSERQEKRGIVAFWVIWLHECRAVSLN